MFTLKNQKTIKFYQEHPEIDFDGINLTFVELLENLEKNMTNTINQNLSVEMLKEISQKIISIETNHEKHFSVLKGIDERTRGFIDSLKSNIDSCILTQKESIIREINNSIKNKESADSELIHKLISDKHEILSQNISKNLINLPKELQQLILSKEDIDKSLLNTRDSLTLEIQKLNASNNLSDDITKLVENKYDQFNASIASRVETVLSSSNSTLVDIHERLKPMISVEEYFNSFTNSNIKGKRGENKLHPILSNILPEANIVNSAGTAESGDFIIERNDKPTILVDTKDYATSVPKKEVEKIIRDIDKHKCCGILLSQNSGISLKYDFEINIHNNFIIVFLHNVEYSEDKISIAIQIIDTLFPIIQKQASMNNESISSDLLNLINKEFQNMVSQKKRIVEQIENHNKSIIKEINKLDVPALATFLSSKFSQPEKLNFICDRCNVFSGKNARALAAHKRGCKIKPTTTTVVVETE